MKKNSLIEGALIATLGIIIVKVIGLLYVIPFNAIIGEQGGALYGYAYNIYNLFLAISSAGFPFAISKLTSEYNALGYKKAVKDTYKLSLKIISIISILIFLLLFIFAPQIGKLIIGNATGGNTISDIAFVIRMVSFAILVVPFLSVTKGFLQGHKYIGPTSISQVLEQIIRVAVILVGSYLALRVFETDMKTAIGIAVSGAFFGGIVAYIYLKIKINKSKILPNDNIKDKEQISKKEIIKKILTYSIPFIIISLIYNLYNTVDMILISRTMNDILGMSATATESVVSVFTTWGVKLNNILLAVITGLTTSLIPNIVSSYTKGDKKDVDNKFNKALQYILFILVPATLFLSFLAEPVWTLFYGESFYGPIVFKVYVFYALFGGLYTIVVNTLQGLSKYKLVITTVFIGLVLNTILDVPMMLLVNKMGYEPSYGAVLAAMIGYSVSIIISLMVLNKKYDFSFSDTRKKLPGYVVSWLVFEVVIVLLKLIIPTNLDGRLIQIPILLLFGVVSFGIYFVIHHFNGNLKTLFNINLKKGRKK
ncbi:MAG: polysaccharide biosynthesis protein [Bacilli bacterium]|nr:polysaccharide biosynthesis protein [Bacilli bacterium]